MKNALLGAVALVLLLAAAALYRRQEALAERLDVLERRGVPTARAIAPVAAEAEPERRVEPVRAAATPSAPERTPAPARPTPPPAAVVDAFTPAQHDAIGREVERQLRARPAALGFQTPEDPLEVMEKELGLSPAQKLRIAELFKAREEEQRKLLADGFKGGPAEHMKAVQELEARHETAIQQQLDFAQQQKYEQLKKDGRLVPGVVFRVQLKADAK
jgi:hypothetical protein